MQKKPPKSVVFCENNIEVMRRYPDKYFDLAFADVPFGIGESGKDHKSRNTAIKQRSGALIKPKQTEYERTDWDDAPPPPEFYTELFRVAKFVILKGCNYVDFPQKASSSGRIFWHKFTGNNDYSDGELMWTNCYGTIWYLPYMWNGMMQGKSLAEPHIPQPNKALNEKKLQPAHTPTLVCMALFSNEKHLPSPGSKILSTHTGSGSDRIAAYHLGHEFVGCENNKRNWQRQEKRFALYISQPDIHRGY